MVGQGLGHLAVQTVPDLLVEMAAHLAEYVEARDQDQPVVAASMGLGVSDVREILGEAILFDLVRIGRLHRRIVTGDSFTSTSGRVAGTARITGAPKKSQCI
jgi:hypothetical protein